MKINQSIKIIKKKIRIKEKINGKTIIKKQEKETKKLVYSGNELKEKYKNKIE